MASDVTLVLREDLLGTDAIVLEADGYTGTPREDLEEYDRAGDESDLMVSVHRETGDPMLITVEEFVDGTEPAVKMLREYPLPWTFSLPQLGIKRKPLEDVLLAVWKKYRDRTMYWE